MPRAQSADGVMHDFPEGTDSAVIDRVMKDYATQHAPQTTAGGLAAAAGRGLAPIAGGAALGAAMGAPFAGIGAVPGAIAGAGAAGLAEAGTAGYDALAKALGLPQVGTAQNLTDSLLDKLGIKRPSTTAERVTEDVSGGAAMAATGAIPTAAKSFATTAGRLASNEAKADSLRDVLAKAAPGSNADVAGRVADKLIGYGISAEGLMHYLTSGDIRGLIGGLGVAGAHSALKWWRDPGRRLETLERIIDRQRRSVDPLGKQ